MKLKIKKFKCEKCQAEYETLKNQPCPSCKNKEVKLLSEEEIDMGGGCQGSCGGCGGGC